MAGLLSLRTSFAERRMHLGYRKARLLADCALGPAGTILRGHEFHYATVTQNTDEPFLHVVDANDQTLGQTGSRRGLVTGSFFHLIDSD